MRWWTGRSSFSTMLLVRILPTMSWWFLFSRSSTLGVALRFALTLPFLLATVFPRRSTSRSALFSVVSTMSPPALWWWAVASFSSMMLLPPTFMMSWNGTWALADRGRRASISFILLHVLTAWIMVFWTFRFLLFFTFRTRFVFLADSSGKTAGTASSNFWLLFYVRTWMFSVLIISRWSFAGWFLIRFTPTIWTIPA